MKTKLQKTFLEIPMPGSCRVDTWELYIKSRFPTGNRPASELSDLFSEKQEVVPLDSNSFCLLHQEFKDFLLKLRPNWGSSFYFDELIGKVSVGVVDRKSSEEALLFALNYRSPRNHLTLPEALDSTGNFEDAKKCEAILYKLPTEKPERYSMGRSLREIVGCFAGAKNFDGWDWVGIRIDLSDMAKEIIRTRNIDAKESLIWMTLSMILAKWLSYPSTSLMAAKAFDILLNRFETVPNFNIRDNKGRTLYDYIMDTPYRGCAIEFLKKIENALQREETPYFPSIEPEIEHLRSIGHRFAMRVEDVLNIVCGESTTFFNVLSDPSKWNSFYEDMKMKPRPKPFINDQA